MHTHTYSLDAHTHARAHSAVDRLWHEIVGWGEMTNHMYSTTFWWRCCCSNHVTAVLYATLVSFVFVEMAIDMRATNSGNVMSVKYFCMCSHSCCSWKATQIVVDSRTRRAKHIWMNINGMFDTLMRRTSREISVIRIRLKWITNHQPTRAVRSREKTDSLSNKRFAFYSTPFDLSGGLISPEDNFIAYQSFVALFLLTFRSNVRFWWSQTLALSNFIQNRHSMREEIIKK